MSERPRTSVEEYFAPLTDPRVARTRVHRLGELITSNRSAPLWCGEQRRRWAAPHRSLPGGHEKRQQRPLLLAARCYHRQQPRRKATAGLAVCTHCGPVPGWPETSFASSGASASHNMSSAQACARARTGGGAAELTPLTRQPGPLWRATGDGQRSR